MSTENIKVESLGDDGEMWIVTGTSDAHSAEEAVRQHVFDECGEPLEDIVYGDFLGLDFKYRTDWGWQPGWDPDDPMDEALLIYGFTEIWTRRFAGFLVTL